MSLKADSVFGTFMSPQSGVIENFVRHLLTEFAVEGSSGAPQNKVPGAQGHDGVACSPQRSSASAEAMAVRRFQLVRWLGEMQASADDSGLSKRALPVTWRR